MTIQEVAEHEMEELEKDAEILPSVDTTTEWMRELELGMWDSISEVERWSTSEVKAPRRLDTDVLDPDVTMSSPIPDIGPAETLTWPMILDALDTVMDASMDDWCSDLDVDMDSEWTYAMETPEDCVDMDWSCSVPNPWMEFEPQEEMAPTWTWESHSPEVWMEAVDASSVVETEDVETRQDNTDLAHKDPLDAEMDELADQFAAMWTPAASEAGSAEDLDSDDQEAEEEVGEEEAELDALEEEYFAAAADNFLAGLGAELVVSQA
ncbi:hypothetical protein B0J17DRAFT_631969 [Rhizoctonia solani]|nr:hypothetical protein B0J17DRAFT_631969 [Rhizoctonia solani]